jgi:hypothetical protein
MNDLVCAHIAPLGKGLAADVTVVRSLAGMSSLVRLCSLAENYENEHTLLLTLRLPS